MKIKFWYLVISTTRSAWSPSSSSQIWAKRALIVVLLTNRVYNGRDPKGIARLRPLLHDVIIEALI